MQRLSPRRVPSHVSFSHRASTDILTVIAVGGSLRRGRSAKHVLDGGCEELVFQFLVASPRLKGLAQLRGYGGLHTSDCPGEDLVPGQIRLLLSLCGGVEWLGGAKSIEAPSRADGPVSRRKRWMCARTLLPPWTYCRGHRPYSVTHLCNVRIPPVE